MIPGSINALLLGEAAGGYTISRSLRFNSGDSAHCSFAPSSAGNGKTWTWAGWVKRSTLGGSQGIWGNVDANLQNGFFFYFDNEGELELYDYSNSIQWRKVTTQVFRDVSAWYHFVISYNTTNATAADRVRIYVNGVRIDSFSTSINPSLNYDGYINNTNVHSIGRLGSYNGFYFSGYLADIHFIDGQALTPSSFGEFDTNGIWQPKAYTGTYGANGFHLDFADNSAATGAALGKDTSGNGNNWTPNNLSVTAGAGNDSLVDSPTNGTASSGGDAGGVVVGNYCTWNPLRNPGGSTLSNGNLDVVTAISGYGGIGGTIAMASGKWYWEITPTALDSGVLIGIYSASEYTDTYTGGTPGSYGYFSVTGNKYNNSSAGAYGASYAVNDVIGVALDLSAGTLAFYKNGVLQGTAYSSLTGVYVAGVSGAGASNTYVANFGQRPFAYAAPSGYKALCSTNLPTPTITTGGFYTGNGVANGPFVYLNGVPTAMTVGGNAVIFGTHADKLSNGFKIRTTSTTYNQNASTYNYTITTTGDPFKTARAQSN